MATAPTRTIFSVLSEILSVLSLFFWNYFKKSDFSYPNHGKYWRITTWLHMLLSVHSASVLLLFITAIFISSSEHLESRKACLKNNIFGQVATFITLLIFLASGVRKLGSNSSVSLLTLQGANLKRSLSMCLFSSLKASWNISMFNFLLKGGY